MKWKWPVYQHSVTRAASLPAPSCEEQLGPCRCATAEPCASRRCRGCSERRGAGSGRPGERGAAPPFQEQPLHIWGCWKVAGFFFTFPQCHDFRFPPSKKREKQPTAERPAAMEEPAANAEPPPGLRSLLPPREFLCSRKGRLLLAEAVRAAGGRLSGGRDGAESGDGAADRQSWKGGDGGRARHVRKPKDGLGYASAAREPLLGWKRLVSLHVP